METTISEESTVQTAENNTRLRVGSLIVGLMGIAFAIIGVVTVLNPMRGEEVLAGITFAELKATNPGVADTMWHLNAGIGTIAAGIGILLAFLAWTGLTRGSREAWYSIAFIAVTFAASMLVAHVPIGHPGITHWGPPLVATLVLLIGLGIAAKPVFSASVPGDSNDRPS